jgi:hypothetical protein
MAATTPISNGHTAFESAQVKFKATLSAQEQSKFQDTTLDDLRKTIGEIQRKQSSERRLRGMQRLEAFLEGMKEFDKIIQVLVNSTPILGYVWVLTSNNSGCHIYDSDQHVGTNEISLAGKHVSLLRHSRIRVRSPRGTQSTQEPALVEESTLGRRNQCAAEEL